MVNGLCKLEIVSDPDELAKAEVDKPFLRMVEVKARLPGGTEVEVTVDLTINLGHLIGGAAMGAAERFNLR